MSNFFLLRGRQALLREITGAWIALTAGSLLFALVAIRLTPAIGQDASYGAALFMAVPTAAMILQAVRTGRLKFPGLPKKPQGVPWLEHGETTELERASPLWGEVMDPEAREGLQWLACLLAARTINPHFSVMLGDSPRMKLPFRIDNHNSVELNSELLMQGPEEFTINVAGTGAKEQLVLVKVNKSKREVNFSIHPLSRIDDRA